MPQAHPSPFFMTQHAPAGAWASLTFGLPGKGVSINQLRSNTSLTADLLIACSHGPGTTEVLPFGTNFSETDWETRLMEAASQKKEVPNTIQARWTAVPAKKMVRQLTPCIDEYRSGIMTFRIYAPLHALLEPGRKNDNGYSCCPGVLLELEIDNTRSAKPATGFIGLAKVPDRGLRPLDHTTDGKLCGVARGGEWGLAAQRQPGVCTMSGGAVARFVDEGQPVCHYGGGEGGVAFTVAPRQRKRLLTAFGFYHEGNVTQGRTLRFEYTRHFKSLEQVCSSLLAHGIQIKRDCAAFDAECTRRCKDKETRTLFAQTVQAYTANTLLLTDGKRPSYAVEEGGFMWLNTMDLAVDHLGWELWRSPWVVRNIIDTFVERYSYNDRVRFDEQPGRSFPGGLSFCHDMGTRTTFTPPHAGGYEKPHLRGCYSFMTTEELLNGVYLLCSYGLTAGHKDWLRSHRKTAAQLMTSLENRDHFDPGQRDGILKADSLKCGTDGQEITSYDNIDHSLMRARGNIYIAFKTWCACLLLEAFCRKTGDTATAHRATTMADTCAASLVKSFDRRRGCFPANVCEPIPGLVSAALEPLAVPVYCGLTQRLTGYRELTAMLHRHAITCLRPGACLEKRTGGLLITSVSGNSWTSKSLLVCYVLAEFLGLDLRKKYRSVMRELTVWLQSSGAVEAVVDNIDVARRQALSAFYYPRAVTTAFLIARQAPKRR